jgi:DNA-binding FadR family transcriptional regulator
MVKAIESGNGPKAKSVMKEILQHGEKYLRKMIDQDV